MRSRGQIVVEVSLPAPGVVRARVERGKDWAAASADVDAPETVTLTLRPLALAARLLRKDRESKAGLSVEVLVSYVSSRGAESSLTQAVRLLKRR